MGIFDFLTPKADGLGYDPMLLPAGADPENDPVVGYDELGQKIRRSRFDGTQYLFEMAPPKTQSVVRGAYREATANPLGFAGDLLSGAIQSAYDAISVPRRAMEGQPLTYGDIAGLTGMMTLGAGASTAPAGSLRMGAAREGQPPLTFADAERAMREAQGIRAYQGSPYNFAAERLVRMPDGSTQYIVGAPDVLPDVPAGAEVLQDFPLGRMRMDKLGTGEGAQAYGSGLYAAEAEDVAKTYRDTLSQNNRFTPYVTYKAEELLKDAGGDYEKAADAAKRLLTGNLDRQQAREIGEVVKLLDDKKVSTGSMYEVQINVDPNAMLDWDKPLGQQSEAIRSAFASLGTPERLASVKGENAYRALQDQSGAMDWPVGASLAERNSARQTASENARQKMLDAGIPGIKYLDEGSRAAGSGTRNFVVFDENLISIVRKYGIAGAAVMLGTSADQISQALTENMTQEELNNLVSGA
jgi:hypothetical protein